MLAVCNGDGEYTFIERGLVARAFHPPKAA